MHITFRPKPLRILASLAIVALFFLLLPKCYTTTASADSGEYTATYTAQQAAAAPSPDGDEIFLISHDVTIRYPRMEHIEVRLRPAYPIAKDMELYVYMYDMQGQAVFRGDLAVLELSPYTCTSLPFSEILEKGETYRIVISDRKDSEAFSAFETLQQAGVGCMVHSDTPFEEISFDCYIFGTALHHTNFLLLAGLCAGCIFLLLFRPVFKPPPALGAARPRPCLRFCLRLKRYTRFRTSTYFFFRLPPCFSQRLRFAPWQASVLPLPPTLGRAFFWQACCGRAFPLPTITRWRSAAPS
ncbi:MAG: hypothetical protein ACLRWF_03370 [Ruthenibacterium sp.]